MAATATATINIGETLADIQFKRHVREFERWSRILFHAQQAVLTNTAIRKPHEILSNSVITKAAAGRMLFHLREMHKITVGDSGFQG